MQTLLWTLLNAWWHEINRQAYEGRNQLTICAGPTHILLVVETGLG